MALRLSQPFLRKYVGNANKVVLGGSSGIGGNIGAGRHYDPTKHMTLEEMKRKSMFYQDVYLDGYVCEKPNPFLPHTLIQKRHNVNNFFRTIVRVVIRFLT